MTTAIVTGGAKRLGKEIALALAKEGINIILHYNTSREEAEKTKKEIEGFNVKCWTINADFSDQEAINTLIDRAFSLTDDITFLINNSSIFPLGKWDKVEFQDFINTFKVNSLAPYLLSIRFANKLGNREGKVVNVLDSIISGYNFERYPYYLSKKLLETITYSLALKLAPNITVNAVAPGLILPPEGKGYDYLEKLKENVPLKRYGSPKDVANAVIFLLKSDFITGQIIYIDGGEHLKPRIVEG
ncbi:MAG: SDR family oxidoreductase [Sulfolobaceae archaeon]|nr:SDR family oxidoreductase [Sulfolobaceae archaeon]